MPCFAALHRSAARPAISGSLAAGGTTTSCSAAFTRASASSFVASDPERGSGGLKASNNEGASASGTWAIGWIHEPATKGWGEGWLCETERERERSSFFSVHVLNPPPLRYRGGSRQSTGPRRERRGGPRRSAGAPTSVSYHAKGGSRGRADHRATASKCANTHGSEGGGQPDGSLGKSTPENTGLRGPTTPANHRRTKIPISAPFGVPNPNNRRFEGCRNAKF